MISSALTEFAVEGRSYPFVLIRQLEIGATMSVLGDSVRGALHSRLVLQYPFSAGPTMNDALAKAWLGRCYNALFGKVPFHGRRVG